MRLRVEHSPRQATYWVTATYNDGTDHRLVESPYAGQGQLTQNDAQAEAGFNLTQIEGMLETLGISPDNHEEAIVNGGGS